jgi:hypothetical protein
MTPLYSQTSKCYYYYLTNPISGLIYSTAV